MERIRKFKCIITDYVVIFKINKENNEALLDEIISDYKNIKALFILLRGAIDTLSEENIKKIKQYTTTEDWKNHLQNKTSWEIIEQNDYILISCDINEFLQNYAKGLGV